MKRGSRILLVAAIAALALPASASAAVSCDATTVPGTVTIQSTTGTIQTSVERGPAGPTADDIIVYDGVPPPGAGTPINCGTTPTVLNTETIAYTEAVSAQASNFVISLVNGPFGPGVTDEGDGSSEIEFNVTFEAGGTLDTIALSGTGAAESFRFGLISGVTTGINLNAAASADLDPDVTASNVDRHFLELAGGNDTAIDSGSSFTGATGPTVALMSANGGFGDDTLTGGNGNGNALSGNQDNDTLTGGLNFDTLSPGAGNDTADGGPSTSDSLSYQNLSPGVTIDLGVTTPQDTGGLGVETISNLESFVGTDGNDTVTGTGGNNSMFGGGAGDLGGDVLIGLGGTDTLGGQGGNDVLNGGDGNDSLTGGVGTDTASYTTAPGPGGVTVNLSTTGVPQTTGGAGNDTLTDLIENLNGSPFDDTLTGTTLINSIVGGAGIDTLTLGDDNDVFDAYDGGPDNVNCGLGADTGIADELTPFPVDTLTDCEAPDHAPQTSIASGPADGGTSEDPTPLYGLAADEAATFQFSVDGGAFQNCASASCEVSALALGLHTLAFRAVGGPLTDLTPVSRTVTIVEPVTTPAQSTGTKKKKCKKKKGKKGAAAAKKCKKKGKGK